MQTWPIHDAKARVSELLETSLAVGPQIVTRRGSEAAGLVPVDERRRLKAAARPSLKQLLLSDQGRAELVTPGRGHARRRAPFLQARLTYLLDTTVVSVLRKPKPHGAVLAWFEALYDAQLQLSAITIGEIQAGIELTRLQDEAKALEIEAWLAQVMTLYNVLPMDAVAFRTWAQLMHRRSDTVYEDAMIAATARIHGLTVVTRNVADFKAFGVPLLIPFGS